jgi:hypothetical protein
MADRPLDLDALALAPPTQALAAALKHGDAGAVEAVWHTLMRAHAPQLRAAWRHYSRNRLVARALVRVLPGALLRELDGAPAPAAPAAPAVPAPLDTPVVQAPPRRPVAPPADTTELVALANAGMVLAAPYLPRLFGALALLADGVFIDDQAAGRAVHLLQYLVTGEAQAPEYQLVLNKILCGLPTAAPVPAGIVISTLERDTIDGLIEAMVAHAKVFGSCSVAAMRQTFLARQGDLQLVDAAWQLRVHPGPFDMLLDRLPWGYAIVKFGWMARPVHVTWRPT